MCNKRNRTPSDYIGYGLYFYVSDLSLRRTSERLSHLSKKSCFCLELDTKIQSSENIIKEKKVDEILIKIGSEFIWLWVAIEPNDKEIFAVGISKERNMFVSERFLSSVVKEYGEHPVSTDGGTWYPQACRFLNLQHHLHSFYEKSIIETTMQYIKDRTESFDDYFPCRKKNCKLKHAINR